MELCPICIFSRFRFIEQSVNWLKTSQIAGRNYSIHGTSYANMELVQIFKIGNNRTII